MTSSSVQLNLIPIKRGEAMLKTFYDSLMKNHLKVWWQKNVYIYVNYEEHFLMVDYYPGSGIHHSLGSIKKTNDNRWRWTMKDSTHDVRFKMPEGIDKMQGVCQTKEEAEIKLETLWGLHA